MSFLLLLFQERCFAHFLFKKDVVQNRIPFGRSFSCKSAKKKSRYTETPKQQKFCSCYRFDETMYRLLNSNPCCLLFNQPACRQCVNGWYGNRLHTPAVHQRCVNAALFQQVANFHRFCHHRADSQNPKNCIGL